MLESTVVQTEQELQQIARLNECNLKPNLTPEQRELEGFLSWQYGFLLLLQMHRLAPSVIVKDGDLVVGYALTALREAASFHPDLKKMFEHLEALSYQGRSLFSCRFYCMGQICVHRDYRGKGIVQKLYAHHRKVYEQRYELLITEISSGNPRSMNAHEKTGFETIYTYTDSTDEWNVVVWNWNHDECGS